MRCRIENGNYDLTGVTDPNIPSSLLKLWLRELTDPLVPVEIYDQCIEVGSDESGDPDMVCKRAYGIVNRLPPSNRAVVLFMIRFLKVYYLLILDYWAPCKYKDN